ncbi:MAG: hypothetical protein AUH11_16795 [Acidobacteria bacterium 13_2_20CM_57_17]|nr:MAG: hypothetical protein AUH11_16795 [Acidobacteria bacterium 13_2_20CM_57_17]OLB97933.1 MAG: hypothetical protein AUI02_00300 [Acidobacteria bacterium 13_2_20CM_2_57_12]
MKLSRKGILLAVLQLAIVGSLAAKYAIDRARFPRVWAQTVAYDPDLPIRGRYLSVRLRVDADRVYGASQPPKSIQGNFWGDMRDVYLYAENGHLVASSAPQPTGLSVTRWRARNGDMVAALSEPVAYFLPEHAVDPSRRQQGEELWVEVTVPKKGPPRPIRLAVKRGDKFTPLEIK